MGGFAQPDTLAPRLELSPHKPTPAQERFLARTEREVLYGGAAGGGKSDALLMAALEYVHVPGYAALILRRSYADLALPGAIMDRAQEWLRGTARWSSQDKRFTFPSGAVIQFGYLEHLNDRFRYQGAEFQFVGFDELTQFDEVQYTYLLSRLRRTAQVEVPLRMRGATNPGGVGNEWVMKRFPIPAEGQAIEPVHVDAEGGKAFVPARLKDNPHLDQETYAANLAELSEVERRQLLEGDWHAARGKFFSDYDRDRHTMLPIDMDSGSYRWYGGFDWGWSAPAAFELGAFDGEGDCTVTDEVYEAGVGDDELAAMVVSTIKGRGLKLSDVPIAADPSMWQMMPDRKGYGERRIEAYLAAGLNMIPADNARVDGWSNLRRYLVRGKLRFFRGRCAALLRTLPVLEPDKNKPEDVDTKMEDHAPDALRYLLAQRPLPAAPTQEQLDQRREAENEEARRISRAERYRTVKRATTRKDY